MVWRGKCLLIGWFWWKRVSGKEEINLREIREVKLLGFGDKNGVEK